MIIILISFLNLSLRGVSHAEAQRNIEHAERKVSRRFETCLTQRRREVLSTQREKLTQRNGGNRE